MSKFRTVVTLGLLIAGLSITLVTVLQNRANQSRDAEVSVGKIVNDFNALQGLPWKADVANGGNPALASKLMAGTEARVYARLNVLRANQPVAQITAVQEPLRRSIAAFEQIRTMAAHRQDVAAGRVQYQIQSTADGVLADLLAAQSAYRNRATTALTFSFVGSTATILLLLGAFLFFYRRQLRARTLSDELARDNERLLELSREEATTDALTGLRNRRALMQDLSELAGRLDDDHRLALAVFDLDGFKQYNDTFGHKAGDALLGRLGERLEATMQGMGTAYRMGGDEFCVIAETDREHGEAIAPLAAAALSEHGDAFSIGCSYGIAVLPTDDVRSPEEALDIADQRMYLQKASGRSSASRQSADVLVKLLSEHSPDLDLYVADVANLAKLISEQIGLAEHEISQVRLAAELHDVGKAALPDAILSKPGPLDEQEWEFMRRHTVIGERIVQAAPSLAATAPLIRSSHERIDGGGYPDGLRGEQIPIGSRIIAVCDAFAAMTTPRRYRPTLSREQAVAELRRCAGTQFDPEIVEIFASVEAAAATSR